MTDKTRNMEEIIGFPEGSIFHPDAEKSSAVEKETQCPICGKKQMSLLILKVLTE